MKWQQSVKKQLFPEFCHFLWANMSNMSIQNWNPVSHQKTVWSSFKCNLKKRPDTWKRKNISKSSETEMKCIKAMLDAGILALDHFQ